MRIALVGATASALVFLLAGCGGNGRSGARAARTATQPPLTQPRSVPTGTIVDQPSGLAGTEVLVHGSVYGLIIDSDGNRLGTPDATSGIELNEIPSASFNQADESGSSFVTRADRYRGSWTTTADGEVRFTVREYGNNTIKAAASTLPIVAHAGAVFSLAFSLPTDLRSLMVAVDEGGDGSVERTIRFRPPIGRAGANDLTPPVSHVTVRNFVDAAGRRMAKVTVTAKDQAGGSGVARIQYALSSTNTSGVYTSPLTLPAEGKIIVRAIDRAGNIEAPYQFVPLRLPP
jgi:hypothetical protein